MSHAHKLNIKKYQCLPTSLIVMGCFGLFKKLRTMTKSDAYIETCNENLKHFIMLWRGCLPASQRLQ